MQLFSFVKIRKKVKIQTNLLFKMYNVARYNAQNKLGRCIEKAIRKVSYCPMLRKSNEILVEWLTFMHMEHQPPMFHESSQAYLVIKSINISTPICYNMYKLYSSTFFPLKMSWGYNIRVLSHQHIDSCFLFFKPISLQYRNIHGILKVME